MDELESRSTLMENEISNMKDRISHVDELENKCELLQRSLKFLTKEQKWKYSAHPIPRSYWEVSTNHIKDDIDGIEELLEKIKNITCIIRSGSEFPRANLYHPRKSSTA